MTTKVTIKLLLLIETLSIPLLKFNIVMNFFSRHCSNQLFLQKKTVEEVLQLPYLIRLIRHSIVYIICQFHSMLSNCNRGMANYLDS